MGHQDVFATRETEEDILQVSFVNVLDDLLAMNQVCSSDDRGLGNILLKRRVS